MRLVLLGAVSRLIGGGRRRERDCDNVDFQFTSFVFFALVLLVWRGSGPLSLDHLARIDSEKEPEIL